MNMKFNVLSLFPEQIQSFFKSSIIFRAIKKGVINIKYWQLRDFANDKHKTVAPDIARRSRGGRVDDTPYGGGRGMVLKVDVVDKALKNIKSQISVSNLKSDKPYIILLTPKGKRFNQKTAQRLSKKKNLVLICGHYEGFDARVENLVDEKISIGDFILSGGEIAAAAIIDSVARLVPGVLAKGSLDEESFNNGKNLEYPQYTRPEKFTPKSKKLKQLSVPKVLLTGNHAEIKKWREENK